MRQVHFCHITDSHLGAKQYGLIERFDDFAKALSDIINKCIQLKPDFVIHTGDLFDNSRPQAPELRQAVKILSKLKEHGIPLYLIQGNHDVSYSRNKRYGGDILRFLADFDLFRYVQDEVVPVVCNGEIIAQLTGLNYYGKRTERVFNKLYLDNYDTINNYGGPNILMLHCFVEGMPGNKDLSVKSIKNAQFDYTAVGHLHLTYIDKKAKIYCPGSSEHTSTSEWQQLERGFFDVYMVHDGTDWNTVAEFIEIETRAKISYTHEFNGTTIADIREEAESIIHTFDSEDAIIRFNFVGSYLGKEHPFINLEYYKNQTSKALHTIISTKFLEIQKSDDTIEHMTDREIYESVLRENLEIEEGLIDTFISAIEDSLEIIGSENVNISDQEMLLDERFDKLAEELVGMEGN